MPRSKSIYSVRSSTEKQATDLPYRLYVWMGAYMVLQLKILRVTCCGRVLGPNKAHSLRTACALHVVCACNSSDGSYPVGCYKSHAKLPRYMDIRRLRRTWGFHGRARVADSDVVSLRDSEGRCYLLRSLLHSFYLREVNTMACPRFPRNPRRICLGHDSNRKLQLILQYWRNHLTT